MSASREKKQRQGASAASNRAQAAQTQAESTRRKTIQYTVIGVVVAVLVAALLIWNSGFFQRLVPAVTINGTSYTAGEVSYYYYGSDSYYYAQLLAQYGGDYNTSRSPRDQVYATDSETGEVTTYHDYFLQSALDNLVSITALYDAAIADGYSEADVKATVDANIESMKQSAASYGYSYKQFLQLNYGKFITPAAFERTLTRSALANLYQNDHLEKQTYTDAEYQAYYQEHADELDTFVYSYLYFTPEAVPTTDDSGNAVEMTDEERSAAQEANLAAAREKAEAARAALEDGSKTAADLMEEYALTNAGAEASSTGSALNSAYSQWLTDAGRRDGDVTLIENGTSGFYVVAFHERYLDNTLSVNVRHILVKAEQDEDASAPTEEQLAAAHTRAEEILAQWKSGAATQDSFAELANELSEDGRDSDGSLLSPGGLYEEVIPGGFVTPFNSWLFLEGERTPGETALIDVHSGARYYGTHVAYFVGENPGDYAWKHTVRDTLAEQDTQTWLEDLQEGYTVTEAGGLEYVAS